MKYYSIDRPIWEKRLEELSGTYRVYASVKNGDNHDYEILSASNIKDISYNTAKPVTPLKSFFLPVKENVSSFPANKQKRIIIGAPNCDIEALRILDEIYLDEAFEDAFYRSRRENTTIISSDCFSVQEHCHCQAYDIKHYSDQLADLSAIMYNGTIILREITKKGESLIKDTEGAKPLTDNEALTFIEKKTLEAEVILKSANMELPGYKRTGELVGKSGGEIWKKYSSHCVSCGACSAICPTCSCFLLIDKPGFHKVKQMDACQYPGFERVAGGEDALHEKSSRFRNRYMCKYVWKPEKFSSIACTGCGRCIEACIGKINKNELFLELAK